jgi:hypothetical protein
LGKRENNGIVPCPHSRAGKAVGFGVQTTPVRVPVPIALSEESFEERSLIWSRVRGRIEREKWEVGMGSSGGWRVR